jgi:hypothetical protein
VIGELKHEAGVPKDTAKNTGQKICKLRAKDQETAKNGNKHRTVVLIINNTGTKLYVQKWIFPELIVWLIIINSRHGITLNSRITIFLVTKPKFSRNGNLQNNSLTLYIKMFRKKTNVFFKFRRRHCVEYNDWGI